jgi:hypothetical protein
MAYFCSAPMEGFYAAVDTDTETYEDLIAALSLIREKRPDIKIILTVSSRPQF